MRESGSHEESAWARTSRTKGIISGRRGEGGKTGEVNEASVFTGYSGTGGGYFYVGESVERK